MKIMDGFSISNRSGATHRKAIPAMHIPLHFVLIQNEAKNQEGFKEIFGIGQNRNCRLSLHALFRYAKRNFSGGIAISGKPSSAQG